MNRPPVARAATSTNTQTAGPFRDSSVALYAALLKASPLDRKSTFPMLRNFPELVFRRTGVKAILAEDALYCVVKGTGVALEHLDTYRKSIIAKR